METRPVPCVLPLTMGSALRCALLLCSEQDPLKDVGGAEHELHPLSTRWQTGHFHGQTVPS